MRVAIVMSVRVMAEPDQRFQVHEQAYLSIPENRGADEAGDSSVVRNMRTC